jgi:putative phosphoribosyl transferase
MPTHPLHGSSRDVFIGVGPVRLEGRLTVPSDAAGIVVFAHGSGSSRHSPRNMDVAALLNRAGIATLLFDLLSAHEATDRRAVFDIELLARRLVGAVGQVGEMPDVADLPVGLFGASTGGGAALWAAADPDADIAAVVSRGGRPDLAAARLGEVRAPTLLIVGELDHTVLELNGFALARLRCEAELAVVPGATHLFAEPGTLEQAAALARGWFLRHFVGWV